MDEPKADDRLRMELLCPITQELPTDPVTACDGRVYERSAIAKWFAEQKASGPRPRSIATSPMTGEIMTTKLMPAVQVRNMISLLVENKQIVGEHADAWLAAMKQAETDRKQKAKGPPTPAPAALDPWEVCLLKLKEIREWHREGLITDEDRTKYTDKFIHESWALEGIL